MGNLENNHGLPFHYSLKQFRVLDRKKTLSLFDLKGDRKVFASTFRREYKDFSCSSKLLSFVRYSGMEWERQRGWNKTKNCFPFYLERAPHFYHADNIVAKKERKNGKMRNERSNKRHLSKKCFVSWLYEPFLCQTMKSVKAKSLPKVLGLSPAQSSFS